VEGYLEPISSDALGQGAYEFDNQLVGNMIPPEFVTAIDKAPLSAAVPSSTRHRTTPPPSPSIRIARKQRTVSSRLQL